MPRTIVRSVTRRVGGLGGIKSLVKGAIMGLGAVAAYDMAARYIPLPVPRALGAAVTGYLAGGIVPAVTAAAVTYMGSKETTVEPVGQVWA